MAEDSNSPGGNGKGFSRRQLIGSTAAAVPSEDAGLRQLLRFRAAGLSSVSTANQGQDRIDHSLYQVELLAGDLSSTRWRN